MQIKSLCSGFHFCSVAISLIEISSVYPGVDARNNNVRSRKIYIVVNEIFRFVSLRLFSFQHQFLYHLFSKATVITMLHHFFYSSLCICCFQVFFHSSSTYTVLWSLFVIVLFIIYASRFSSIITELF